MAESHSFKFSDASQLHTALSRMRPQWEDKNLRFRQRHNLATDTFSGPVSDKADRVVGWITYRREDDGSGVMTLSNFQLDPNKSAVFAELKEIVTQHTAGAEPVNDPALALKEEVHDLTQSKREPRKRARPGDPTPASGSFNSL